MSRKRKKAERKAREEEKKPEGKRFSQGLFTAVLAAAGGRLYAVTGAGEVVGFGPE